jgi:transglutaminase-like putative cysteine protease
MKKIFILLFCFISLGIAATSVSAQVLEKETVRNYSVQDNYIDVTETKTIKITQQGWRISTGEQEVFTIFLPNKGDPSYQEKYDQTKASIQLTSADGSSLSYTLDESSETNMVLKLGLPRDVTFQNDLTITLKYKSFGLIVKSGNIRDIFVPSFNKDYQFQNDTKKETVKTLVTIPQSFGEINFISPHVPFSSSSNNWTVEIASENLIGENAWIQVGTVQYYSFVITQDYAPTTTLPLGFNTYTLPIPRDIDSGPISQEVYYTSISPKPHSVELDSDGNLMAKFMVPAKETGKIEIKGYATLTQNKNFNPLDSGVLTDIPKDILERNTLPGLYWEVADPEIKKIAAEIRGNNKDIYTITKDTYNYVVDLIDYDETKKFGINNTRQGALKTLQGGAAVCMEYSDLFIALMRAQGIPARAAFGHGYSALDFESSLNKTINHQWAEVYLPKLKTWINVDTTWGENGPALIGGDLNHFYSHVASQNPEVPSSVEVKFVGKLENVPEQISEISTVEKLPDNIESNSEKQDDLLKSYKPSSKENEGLSNITRSISFFFSDMNKSIDRWLKEIFPNLNSAYFPLIKLIPVFIILIFFTIVFIKKRLKRRTKTITPSLENSVYYS